MAGSSILDDLIYEIFKYFCAVDDDGPLTLMALSTLWRDRVLVYPPFWTWILIDDDIPDIEARVNVFATLSAELPLHITLRHRFASIHRFRSLLGRCQTLFIYTIGNEDPYLMPHDTRKDVNILKRLLVATQAQSLKYIYHYTDNISSSENGSLYNQLKRNRNSNDELNDYFDLQGILEEIPAAMITEIRLEEASFGSTLSSIPSTITKVPTTRFWSLISQLLYIRTLVISTVYLVDFLPEKISIVFLPHLRDLTVTAWPNRGPDWDIISSIQAPSIHSVTLSGALHNGHIFKGIEELEANLEPRRLTLKPFKGYSDKFWSDTASDSCGYNLATLRELEIVFLMEHVGEELINWSMERINTMIKAIHNLEYLHFDIPDKADVYIPLIPSVSCLLYITCPVTFESSMFAQGNNKPLVQLDNSKSLQIEQLTLFVGEYDLERCFDFIETNKLKIATLVIQNNDCRIRTMKETPSLWIWSCFIQKMDIEDVGFSWVFQLHKQNLAFPNLTFLRCPVKLATAFIAYNRIPHLRELTLSRSGTIDDLSIEFQEFSRVCLDIRVYSRFHPGTLALEFYPSRPTLFQILSTYASKPRSFPHADGVHLQCLKLPTWPHISIFRAIVSALGSKEWNSPTKPFNGTYSGCRYCEISGRDCLARGPGEFCRLHAQGSLVSITKNTL